MQVTDRPGEPTADRPARHASADRHGAVRRRFGPRPDPAPFLDQPDPQVAAVSDRGQVVPKGNGTATIVARHGLDRGDGDGQGRGMDQPAPVSFRRDVIPAFSQAGCNTGACHGTPTGKGGFRLSLRGYLPDQDFSTLSREVGGRRINLMAADTSLHPPQAAGRSPPRGGTAADAELQELRVPPRLDRGRRQGRPRRAAAGRARDPARVARPQRPGRQPSSSSCCSTWPTAPSAT